ncbi:MAG: hypothetical protein HQ559_01625 [Lentisphaerae bacterium]|nr:hypothetical protein [Lentisphaerota bacterium]
MKFKSKIDVARAHCANWRSSGKDCLFDKPCEPAKCDYFKGVVTRCAEIAATETGRKSYKHKYHQNKKEEDE